MTHSPDFAAVRWGRHLFTFSPKQRVIVAVLWHAKEQGYEYVTSATLFEEAESDTKRVRDLFRGHPAWNTMIVSAAPSSGALGSFRLADFSEPTE